MSPSFFSSFDPSPLSCPKWSELLPHRSFQHLKLHTKKVACSVSYDAVRALEMSALSASNLARSLPWVEDFDWYSQFEIPPLRKHRTRFTPADITALREANKFVLCDPLCGVDGFPVPEWDRGRKRPIMHPDINAAISKDILIKGLIPRKEFVRANAAASRWSVQFDFASWYDQLPLHIKISALFCFQDRQCLASLPMGFRPSADVAQSITAAIADFPLPAGVNVTVYIDNIRFGGPSKAAVTAAAKTFLERADKVGAIVNEREIVAKEHEDFLGEHYDLVKKLRSLTSKNLDKLRHASKMLSSPLTVRQLAAIFGLLFFSSEVLRANLSLYFQALSFYRRTMSSVNDWDAPAPALPEPVLAKLVQWFKELIRNKPTPIVSPLPQPDLSFFCDASEFGWGAVSISSSGVQLLQGQWTAEDKATYAVGSSTVAEPLAVRRIAALTVNGSHKHVRILSDHMGLIFSGNKGYGKCQAYNDMCSFLHTYTNTTFTFGFVPGKLNVTADKLSREKLSKESIKNLAFELPELKLIKRLGSTLVPVNKRH